jgi:hypothetical protein
VEEFGVISTNRLINACSTIIKNKFSYAFSGMEFPYRVQVYTTGIVLQIFDRYL